jgi:CheY-like chemotaxis protein
MVLEVLRNMLSNMGYLVTSVGSSIAVLTLFRKTPSAFDLVLTDMTMPKMTGDWLAVEIKNIRPDIPIILCTGYSDKLAGKSAEDLGLQGIVMKPIEQAVLARMVRNVLDGN